MGQDIPLAPPEAEVIRLARKAAGMTAEDAAAASKAHDPAGRGVSATYWRDIERGQGGRRGQRVATRASDRILAAMARVVGVRPAQLTGAGREDAARVLEEILRREGSPVTLPAPRDDSPFTPPVTTPEMEQALRAHLPGIMARLEVARADHPGEPLTGELLYPLTPKYAGLWDQLAMLGYPPEGTAWFMAVALSWETEAAKAEDSDGFAAGLARRRVTVPP